MAKKPSPIKGILDGINNGLAIVTTVIVIGLLIFIYWKFKAAMPT